MESKYRSVTGEKSCILPLSALKCGLNSELCVLTIGDSQGSLKEQNWYLGVLSEWLTGCGLDSPTMAVSWWKGQKSGGCLVHLNECLSSPSLVLSHRKFMRTTGRQPLLGSSSSFSHQQRNASPAGDKLASQGEVSRQTEKAFFFFVQYMAQI